MECMVVQICMGLPYLLQLCTHTPVPAVNLIVQSHCVLTACKVMLLEMMGNSFNFFTRTHLAEEEKLCGD